MIKLPPTHTNEYLFLCLIHEIQEKFANHAILRGGMVLQLLGSSRKTLDLDYTFIPFKSKNDVLADLNELCSSIEGASIKTSVNSKVIHLVIQTERASIQIEVNVGQECKAVAISTNLLAKNFGIPPRVIKIMSYDVSLAHKLAAWFERRLMRDLYDIYFLSTSAGPNIDISVLLTRLDKIDSRIPKLKKIKKVNLKQFFNELENTVMALNEKMLKDELTSFLDDNEFPGLDLMIRRAVLGLVKKYRPTN